MSKFSTKNGTTIYYLYSSLISKRENENCLRYFVKYASPKEVQYIIKHDKDIIIKLIGEENFNEIFKGI